jgi:hypothetical protein
MSQKRRIADKLQLSNETKKAQRDKETLREIAISTANMVPPGEKVSSFNEVFDYAEYDLLKPESVEHRNQQFRRWLQSLRKYPKLFEFVSTASEVGSDGVMFSALSRFADFKRVREFIVLLADYAEKYEESVKAGDPYYYWHGLRLPVTLEVGDKEKQLADGIIQFKHEWFMDAFEGEDIRKIRRCPVCKIIFWQSRSNKKSCSRPCSNVEAKRKERRSPATLLGKKGRIK